ncbi:RagB/SusD family nutrient uptake outer membrane protein [Chitinophaga arvensicola]|uniref:SusD family protein n=1 Tax=Chitinophaga arvensicola TaxID=29529 RepID=A0A1I0S742_9BACT|nr:RagB/SusD family nutrient uptake outer membrane protein [Chitinophaga arvensicola]SEW51570.1 SusD family protein [Chitinophaga arvensicola]
MKKITISLISVAVLLFTSCNKFLDIKPKGYSIPEFYEDYAKLLNDQYLIRVSSAYPAYLTDEVSIGVKGDPVKGAEYSRLPAVKKNLYSFQGGAIFLPGESDVIWETAYSHMFTYNVVINNVMKVPDATDKDKRELKAVALLGRAYELLTLVNAYAAHYDPQTAKNDLGVPIVKEGDINETYKRNTVAEVYDQIRKDLEESLPDLPEKARHVFYPSKSIGFAFLSRMYLYMGDYANALKNAKEALNLKNTLLDYNLYTTKTGTTYGRVCLASDNTVVFPAPQDHPEDIWVRLAGMSMGSVNAEVYASPEILSVFEKNLPATAVDKRMELFFCNGKANFSTREIQFPGRVLYAPYIDFNIGLGTPELYLIAGECEARLGQKDAALNYINALRSKRIRNHVDLTAATADEALVIALDERQRELCYSDNTRLIDLKRLNKEPRFARTIVHKQGTETFSLPPNDKRYILPVPPKVLELNATMPVYER